MWLNLAYPFGKFVAWASVPGPGPQTEPLVSSLQDIATVSHDGAWQEEIEIELRDLGDDSYKGTMIVQFQISYLKKVCYAFNNWRIN